ncbi:MAG: hypothetical protein V4590_01495 [Bacteroidota bacterium]
MENRIHNFVTPDNIALVESHVLAIQTELPFLIELTPIESKRLSRMEIGRSEFVRRALIIAEGNEQLRPQFINFGDIEVDLNLIEGLDKMIGQVGKLFKQLNDTRDRAGHEAYGVSREIYSTVKRAAAQGIPGASQALEELRQIFEREGRVMPEDNQQNG